MCHTDREYMLALDGRFDLAEIFIDIELCTTFPGEYFQLS